MTIETVTSSVPSEEDVTEMHKLMSDGKRNYVCNQPHLALDCFVELCEKLSKCYGQESDKCVEAYLYYGKTLLDVARLENGVLGHAIKEMPVFGSGTETDDQETEKECNTEDEEDVAPLKPDDRRTFVERAMREDNLYNESTDEQTEEEEEDNNDEDTNKMEEGDGDAEKEGGDVTSTSTNTENKSCTDESTTTLAVEKSKDIKMDADDGIDCEGSDDDDNDDVSNLELSWEMFELTSVICKKQLSEEGLDYKAIKTALAEAKYGLAQISLEAGRYEDSVNDFTECLDLYKEILDDQNGRVIAEGHYNIALAFLFDKKYVEAIKGFEKAVAILKARVQDLASKVKLTEEKAEKTDKDLIELVEWKKEIPELNDLIDLDMMAKIEDAQEAKHLFDETIKTCKDAISGTKSEFDTGFSEGFDAPLPSDGRTVHDCTKNIRSVKRKSDDEESCTIEKKVKQTNTEVSSSKQD